MKTPTPKEYDGQSCPCCGNNNDIEGQGTFPSDCDGMDYEIRCNACGASWTEEHTLTGYYGLRKEDGEIVQIPENEPEPDLLAVLVGLRDATRKAYEIACASNDDFADTDAHFVGEWLDTANEAIAKAK